MDLKSLLNPGRVPAVPSPPSASLPPSPALVPTPRLKLPSVRSWGIDHSMNASMSVDIEEENKADTPSGRVQFKARLDTSVATSPRGSLPSDRVRPPPPELQMASSTSHKVYHTTLLYNSLSKTLQAIRKEAGLDQQLQSNSLLKIGHTFNEDPRLEQLRPALWNEWNDYARFCAALDIPPFPITPVKAALCITRYVDLPISSRLRAMTDAKNGPSVKRVEVAFKTLRQGAQATSDIWKDIAAGFVEDPSRYVLFHEIMEAAGTWVATTKKKASAESDALAELLRARPGLARVKPVSTSFPSAIVPPQAAPAPKAIAPPARPLIAEPPQRPLLQPKKTIPARKINQEDLVKLRKYYHQDLSPVTYQYFFQDFDIITLDMALRQGLDTDVSQNQAHRLYLFQQHPHPRAARVRDVAVLFTHLAHLLPFHPFPITPIKLALFALAYSPETAHVERFDKAEGTKTFVKGRMYPRLLKEEITHALDDLELIQVVSRGDRAEKVTEFEMEQWGEWRMGIMKDLWGDLPGLNAPRPSRPPEGARRGRRSAKGDANSSVPLDCPPYPAPPPFKRRKSSNAALVSKSDNSSPVLPRGASPTLSSTSSSNTSSNRPRRRSHGGWYHIRAPSPHPLFVPTVRGSLPSSRRPPEVPPVLPSSQVWVFGSTEDKEKNKRTVASHRPRRTGPEMRELDWSESSEGEKETD